jgi:hypothetical protein
VWPPRSVFEDSAVLAGSYWRIRTQSFIQHGLWKQKTSRTTSCSTLTGYCHYQYTTECHWEKGFACSFIVTHGSTDLRNQPTLITTNYVRILTVVPTKDNQMHVVSCDVVFASCPVLPRLFDHSARLTVWLHPRSTDPGGHTNKSRASSIRNLS